MTVLSGFEQRITAAVTASGYPVSHSNLKNEYSWTLARFDATDARKLSPKTVMCSRQAVRECLRSGVPDEAITRKFITEVSGEGDEGWPQDYFVDGSSIDAGLNHRR